MPRPIPPAFTAFTAFLLALAGGCASAPPGAPPDVPAERYATTFDAARDVLRERRFDLARVDSSAGVLTTEPSVSAGLFTPWSRDQQTFDDELDDTLNWQQRTVRVEFAPVEPTDGTPGPAGAAPVDLVAHPRATRLEVRVTIERQHRAGQQPQPASSFMTSRWDDPALDRRGLGNYKVTMRRDEALERAIVAEITERAGP
jgi:hypothetical protein